MTRKYVLKPEVEAERQAVLDKIRDLAAQGMSQSTIATHIGRSRERVRQICNREGIVCLDGSRNHDRDEIFASAINSGAHLEEAAKAAGVSPAKARLIAKHLGLTPTPTPRLWHAVRDYAAQGMTLTETADALLLTTQVAWNIAKAHGITFSRKFGEGHYLPLQCVWDGVEYPSIRAATMATGVSPQIIRKSVRRNVK